MIAPFRTLGVTFDTTPESTGGFFLGVNCNMESEGMLVTLCTLYIRGQMRGKNKQHCRVIIKIVLALQTLGPDATLRTTGFEERDPAPCPSGKPTVWAASQSLCLALAGPQNWWVREEALAAGSVLMLALF